MCIRDSRRSILATLEYKTGLADTSPTGKDSHLGMHGKGSVSYTHLAQEQSTDGVIEVVPSQPVTPDGQDNAPAAGIPLSLIHI